MKKVSWICIMVMLVLNFSPLAYDKSIVMASENDAFSEDFSSGVIEKPKWDYISGKAEVVDDESGNKVGWLNEKDIIAWTRLDNYSYLGNITEISFRFRMVDSLSQIFVVQMRNRIPEIDQTLSLFAVSNGEMLFAPWSKQSVKIQNAEANTWYTVKIVLDGRPDVNVPAKLGIYIDGVLKQQMTSFDFVDTSGTKPLNKDFLKTETGAIRAPELRFAVQAKNEGDVPSAYMDDISVKKTGMLPEGAKAPVLDKTVVQLDPSFIYEPGKFNYGIRIDNIRDQQISKYTVNTKIVNKETGEEKEYSPYEVSSSKGSAKLKTVNVNNIKEKGVYSATWTVKYDGQIVDTYTQNFAVMDSYKDRYLDKYTPFAINAGFDKTTPEQTKQTLDILKKTGFKVIRAGITWGNVERVKGEIDLAKLDNAVRPALDNDIQILFLLAFNNSFYFTRNDGSNSNNYGPRTKENIEGYINYAKTVAERYPQIKMFELWNEPDHQGFWGTKPDPIQLSNLIKAASLKLHEVRPDATLISNTIGKSHDKVFTPAYFAQGVLSYVDAYSDHLYEHGTGPKPELFMERLREHARSTVDAEGAWKDIYQTETGFTMVEGAMGVTEQEQAEFMVKRLLATILEGHKMVFLYSIHDAGTDKFNKEHNFGILNYDYSPKLALVSCNQMLQKLQGGEYIGKIAEEDGTGTYVFNLEGKPVAITWTHPDTTREMEFKSSVSVEDQYGNVVQNGTKITFDTKPKYILGLDNSYFAIAAGNSISDLLTAWQNKWFAEGMAAEKLTNVKKASDELKQYAENIQKTGTLPKAEEVSEKLKFLYQTGEDIISAYQSGELDMTEKNTMVMLYELHQISKYFMNLYTISVNPDRSFEPQAAAKINTVQEKIDAKENNDGKLRFSEDVLAKAKELSNKCDEIKKEKSAYSGKTIMGYDLLAGLICDWADKICNSEISDESHNILIQSDPTRMEFYGSNEKEIAKICISNNSPKWFKGYLGVYDENDQLIGDKKYISVKQEKSKLYEIPVHYTGKEMDVSANYKIKLFKDNELFKEQELPIKVLSQFNVKLNPAITKTENIKRVTVNVTEVGGAEFKGKVKLTPPEGWKMASNTEPLVIEAGKPTNVNLAVSQTKPVPFNQYVFKAEIYDDDEQLLYNQSIPLDFSLIVKAKEKMDPSTFTGDISDWSDAYPVFVAPPQDPEKLDEWEKSNVALKAFMKWDNDYFYVLADVFDDVHHVLTKGADSWNGDSLQVSFDTLNTNSVSTYDADDYEYTFSLHSAGEQVYAHAAATPKLFGDRPSEWLKVFRDDSKKTTRYFVRIPRDELAPMKFEENNVIGLNVAVNDGDLVNRDRFIESTPGTASKKNPSAYNDWYLIGGAEGLDPTLAKDSIDLKIEQNLIDEGAELNQN